MKTTLILQTFFPEICRFRLLFTVLLLVPFALSLQAQNIRSGDITYTNLGNNQYNVTATVFYDCDGSMTVPNTPLQLNAFGATTDAVLSMDMLPLKSQYKLGADELADFCFCGDEDDLPCVIKATYCATVTVQFTGPPGNPINEGVVFVVNSMGPNRSVPIGNLMNQGEGFSMRASAPDDSVLPGNNSPVFSGANVKVVCQQERCINISGIDPDIPMMAPPHNRLVYTLVDPTTLFVPPSTDQKVSWKVDHTDDDFFGLDGITTLNPNSGILCFDATNVAAGTYIFSVKVDEYMEDPNNPGNSLLIGCTFQDFQLVVLDDCPCCPVTAGFSGPTTLCSGDIAGFSADANTDCPDEIAHYWDFGDGGNRSYVENVNHNYQGQGTFTAQHIADNGCAIDTVEVQITVNNCCVDGYRTDNYVQNGLFNNNFNCGVGTFLSQMTDDCGTTSLADNHYMLVNEASQGDLAWSGTDNSGLDSLFFLGNGDNQDRMAWEQTVTITNAATYCFCLDVKNVCETCPGQPRFRLWADGNIIFTSNAIAFADQWVTLCENIKITSTGNVVFGIEVLGSNQADNAFGLDNIYVRKYCGATIGFGKDELQEEAAEANITKVYPNPVKLGEPLSIEYVSETEEQVFVEMTDVSGKVVWTKSATVYQGENRLTARMQGVSAGVYHVNIVSANNTERYKILVTE